nr:hypothetical protein [Propionivibrio limicola]
MEDFLAAVFEPGQRQRDGVFAELTVLSDRAGAVVIEFVVAGGEFDAIGVCAVEVALIVWPSSSITPTAPS